nr:UNC93-like protein 3 [Tanacetum cinerariifolium]
MAITFADTHNMIAYLTKSDASEGFDQIIDLLNVNDVTRLQALIDRKKVIITEAIIREAPRLDDVESIDCLPNEEIFTELSRMGYEKPSTKLTFYKAFFSPQWKFLIHTILQCMSAKRTSWNEFSYSIALVVICLSTGRKFNFSKAQVGDLFSHTTKYSSPALIKKVFANMRRVGKGFSEVETPLFEGMIVAQQADDVADEGAAGVDVDVVPAVEPSIPSPTPTTQPPPPSQELPSTSQVIPTPPPSPIAEPSSPPQQQQHSQLTHDAEISLDLLQTLLETCTTLTRKVEALEQDKVAQALEIIKLKQRVKKLERKNKLKVYRLRRLRKVGTAQRIESSADTVMDDKEDASKQGEIIANIDADEDVILKDVAAVEKTAEIEENADVQGRLEKSQAKINKINLEHADKVLSIQDDELEPAELKKVVEVVTTAKLMTEVVTAASATITTPTTDKGKRIMVEEPKPLKKQAQIEQDEAYAKELEAELNKNINWDDVIEQVQRKEKEDNVVLRYQALKRKPQTEAQARKNMTIYLKKSKEQLEEEASKALKRASESQEEKAVKKQKLDEEVLVVDYEIYTENSKPYFKIIKADGTHQLFLSFLSLLRNFDREDLEVLWQLVKERFASSKPKNFSDDFLLTTLTYMFEKPDVEAQVWKSQRGVYGLAKVKSWRLLESCGVHVITLTTTQIILLVERRYPLTMFTLDQMLNNVRLEVEEESEVFLKTAKIYFKKNMLRDQDCRLKTYCCQYKLMLLDAAADIKLRLLEQSAADGDLETISLGILYTSFTVSSLFASSMVRKLESKNALLLDNIISELPSYSAVTPSEPVDSLNMGDEHLNTIPTTESDEFIKIVAHMKEIDLPFTSDDPMSPGIEDDAYDSGRDILILEELLKMMGDISDQKGLEAFQPSAECPMIINGKNIPLLDVALFHFYPP